ncbi:MAG: hypothetical protein IJX63_07340 [Lachnospiraceae bacterium]|nr:hypothetical protein [Lachnospiraceae bacterium]
MAMGTINIVTMTRSQDFTAIKQNEDNKSAMTQMALGQKEDKEIKQRSQQVVQKEETQWHQRKFDAREQGDNQYAGDGGRYRKNGKQVDQVIVKGQQGGFDVKI